MAAGREDGDPSAYLKSRRVGTPSPSRDGPGRPHERRAVGLAEQPLHFGLPGGATLPAARSSIADACCFPASWPSEAPAASNTVSTDWAPPLLNRSSERPDRGAQPWGDSGISSGEIPVIGGTIFSRKWLP